VSAALNSGVDRRTPQTSAPFTGDPIVLTDVSVFYGEVVGLSNVSLTLRPGITGIVGPNGSGKSTLMRVLTGLIAPQEGRAVVLGGNSFADASIRSRIRLVPATQCFHDELSGRRNLEIAFLARGHDRRAARDLAAHALDVIHLTADGNRRVRTWSRGMRQRLKLGLALADDSELVLLDEPFLGVDPPSRRELSDAIEVLGKSGRTVLVSSHVLHEVESLTDRVGVLAHGRLLGFGKIEDLLRDLRDRHPHRVEVSADDPRALGAALLGLSHVRELKVTAPDRLEFVTDRPETAYRELAALVVGTGVPVRGVHTLDNTLEAVFKHVTAGGTRRL
jgi:ABC-2 type transport system ATP-binding protein